MKYLKLFEDINLKSLKWYNNKIMSELKTVINFTGSKNDDTLDKRMYRDTYSINLNNDTTGLVDKDILKKKKEIIRILNKWKSILIRQGIILDFKLLTGLQKTYLIYKELYKDRVKPNRFVYHSTPSSNRESILEKGLLTKPHSQSKEFSSDLSLSYPPSIFASNGSGTWNSGSDVDIWQIDTSKINNKWYKDLNLQTKYRIMTFESIPASALKLITNPKDIIEI